VIAERLIAGQAAATQCGANLGDLAVRRIDPELSAQDQRTAGNCVDDGGPIWRFRRTVIELVMERARRAATDDLGDDFRRRGGRLDPGSLFGVKYLRQPADALGEMEAPLGVVGHGNAVAAVHPDVRLGGFSLVRHPASPSLS
jgi:hypothetical protein